MEGEAVGRDILRIGFLHGHFQILEAFMPAECFLEFSTGRVVGEDFGVTAAEGKIDRDFISPAGGEPR